jgi:hypothetical protein
MNRAQELETQLTCLQKSSLDILRQREELLRELLEIQNSCDHEWGEVYTVLEPQQGFGFPYRDPAPIERRKVTCTKCVTTRHASVVGL